MTVRKALTTANSGILRERIAQYGISTLMDEEIIHLLTGIAVEKVRAGLSEFGIIELIKYSDSMNLTEIQKSKISMLYEFIRRFSTALYKDKLVLDSSSKAGAYFVNELQNYITEVFLVIFLDSQNRLITKEVMFKGTINETAVYPREIVKKALQYNSGSIIVAHNHPGGSLKASHADIETTKKLSKALEAVAIKLVDHIVVGEGKYSSFAEKGLM